MSCDKDKGRSRVTNFFTGLYGNSAAAVRVKTLGDLGGVSTVHCHKATVCDKDIHVGVRRLEARGRLPSPIGILGFSKFIISVFCNKLAMKLVKITSKMLK